VSEAHAADEWPIGPSISFCQQPKNVQERCVLANKYAKQTEISFPIVVDNIQNNFDNIFAAWPVRFYVVDGTGKLLFKAQPESFGYDLRALARFLKNY